MEQPCQSKGAEQPDPRNRTLKLDGVIRRNTPSGLSVAPSSTELVLHAVSQSVSGVPALSGLYGLCSLGLPNLIFPSHIIVK